MNYLKSLTIMSSCFLFTTPLIAAEQTVANAQKFLTIILPDKGIQSGDLKKYFSDMADEHDGSARLEGYSKITNVTTIDRCISKINYDNNSLSLRVYHGGSMVEPVVSLRPDLRLGSTENGIDWGKVLEVKQSKELVSIRLKNNEPYTIVSLGSEDIATRVNDAMTFLKQKCDSGNGTSF